MILHTKKLLIPALGAAVMGASLLGGALPAMAHDMGDGVEADHSAVFSLGVTGTVTAVNGSTITVAGQNGGTFTINTSGSTVEKFVNDSSTTVAPSTIAVGDTVRVKGTVVTASLTASDIKIGALPNPMHPIAFGTVTAINGSTITLATKGKMGTTTTYSVNASNATIVKVSKDANGKKFATSTMAVSAIAVGDTLAVKGSVNGSTITATNIFDLIGLNNLGKHLGEFLKHWKKHEKEDK